LRSSPTQFRPRSIFFDLIVGLVIGINAIIFCVAYATLFSIASPHIVVYMTGLYLLGSALLMIFCALFSELEITIAAPQNHAIAVLLAIAAHINNTINLQTAQNQLIPTLFSAFALTTLLTGISYLVVGYFRKGNLIRFIPYPVMCGFLAGLGWAMFSKAVLALNTHPGADSLEMTAAAITFALLAYFIQQYYKKPLAILGLFFTAVIIFYIFLYVGKIPLTLAITNGWVLTLPTTQSLLQLPTLNLFTNINWHALYSVMSLIFIVVLVNNISLLMNTISVETSTKKDMNFNYELCITGIANIFASAGGGIAGYIVVGQTLLVQALKGGSRLVGVIAGGCCLLALLFGAGFISYLPKFALFGMLLFIAISFLIHWLGATFFRLSRQDYLILIIIFFTICCSGFYQVELICWVILMKNISTGTDMMLFKVFCQTFRNIRWGA